MSIHLETKKIIVRPVRRKSVQGRNLQTASYKRKDKAGNVIEDFGEEKVLYKNKATSKNGKSLADIYCFKEDYERGVYKTGLEQTIPNPFYLINEEKKTSLVNSIRTDYNLHPKWNENNLIENIVEQEIITRQQFLEIRFGLEPNFLSSRLPERTNKGVIKDLSNLSYIAGFKLVLYDEANIFSNDNLRGAVALQLIESRGDKIAHNGSFANPSKHSHYIAEEYEDAKKAKRLNDLENDCIHAYMNLKKSHPNTGTLEDNVLYILACTLKGKDNKPLVKGPVVPLVVEEKLNSYIKQKGTRKEKSLQEFLGLIDLFNNPSSKDLFYLKYLQSLALVRGVLYFSKGSVVVKGEENRPERHMFRSMTEFTHFMQSEIDKYETGHTAEENAYVSFIEKCQEKDILIPSFLLQ